MPLSITLCSLTSIPFNRLLSDDGFRAASPPGCQPSLVQADPGECHHLAIEVRLSSTTIFDMVGTKCVRFRRPNAFNTDDQTSSAMFCNWDGVLWIPSSMEGGPMRGVPSQVRPQGFDTPPRVSAAVAVVPTLS